MVEILKLLRGVAFFLAVDTIRMNAAREIACDGLDFECEGSYNFITCEYLPNGQKFYLPNRCRPGAVCNPRNSPAEPCDFDTVPSTTVSTAPTSTADRATTLKEASTLPYIRSTPSPNYDSGTKSSKVQQPNNASSDINRSLKVNVGVNVSNLDVNSDHMSTNVTTSTGFQPSLVIKTSATVEINKNFSDDLIFSDASIQQTPSTETKTQSPNSPPKIGSTQFSVNTITEALIKISHLAQRLVAVTNLQLANTDSGVTINLTTDVNGGKTNTNEIALAANTTVSFDLVGPDSSPGKVTTELTVNSSKLSANMPENSLQTNTDNKRDSVALLNVPSLGDKLTTQKDIATPKPFIEIEITQTTETIDCFSSVTSENTMDDAFILSGTSGQGKTEITTEGKNLIYRSTTSLSETEGTTETLNNHVYNKTSKIDSVGEHTVATSSYYNISTTNNLSEYSHGYIKIIESTYTDVSSLNEQFLELLTQNDARNSSVQSTQPVLHDIGNLTQSDNQFTKHDSLENQTATFNVLPTSFASLNSISMETLSTQIEPSVNVYAKYKNLIFTGNVLDLYEPSVQTNNSISVNIDNVSQKLQPILGIDVAGNDSDVLTSYPVNALQQNKSSYYFENTKSTLMSPFDAHQDYLKESLLKLNETRLNHTSKESLNGTYGIIDSQNPEVTYLLYTQTPVIFEDNTQKMNSNFNNYTKPFLKSSAQSVDLTNNYLQQNQNQNISTTVDDLDLHLEETSTKSPYLDNYFNQKLDDMRNELISSTLNVTETIEEVTNARPTSTTNMEYNNYPLENISPYEANTMNKTTTQFFASYQDANETTPTISVEVSAQNPPESFGKTTSNILPTETGKTEEQGKITKPTPTTKPNQISAEVINNRNVMSLEVNKGDVLSVERPVGWTTQKHLVTSMTNGTTAANQVVKQPELLISLSQNVDRGVRASKFNTSNADFNTTTEVSYLESDTKANDPVRYNITAVAQDQVDDFDIGQQIQKDILIADCMNSGSLFTLKAITVPDETQLRLSGEKTSNSSSWLLDTGSVHDVNINASRSSETNKNYNDNTHNKININNNEKNNTPDKTETILVDLAKNNLFTEPLTKTTEESTISPNWPDLTLVKSHPVISETTFDPAEDALSLRANPQENAVGKTKDNKTFDDFQGNSYPTQKPLLAHSSYDDGPLSISNSSTSNGHELYTKDPTLTTEFIKNFGNEKPKDTAVEGIDDLFPSSTTNGIPNIVRESPYNFEKISYMSQFTHFFRNTLDGGAVNATDGTYAVQNATGLTDRSSVNESSALHNKTWTEVPSSTNEAEGNDSIKLVDTRKRSSNVLTAQVNSSDVNNPVFTAETEGVNPLENDTIMFSTLTADYKKPPSANNSGINPGANVSQEQIALATSDNTGQNIREASFLCTTHGVFPDVNDCRQYYLCVQQGSTFVKIVGTCPPKMAFNANVQRCERDVSSCYREKCRFRGNFTDPLDDTSYFSCVEIARGAFHKYHVQCDFPLKFNPTERRCDRTNNSKSENYHTSTIHVPDVESTTMPNPIGYSDHNLIEPDYKEMHATTNNYETAFIESFPVNDSINGTNNLLMTPPESNTESSIRAVRSASIFECSQDGLYRNPDECREYYMCVRKSDGGFTRIVRQCPRHYAFHARTKSCSRDLAVCSDLWCYGVGNFPDPKDESCYYRCVPNASGGFRIYHIQCMEPKVYVHAKNGCFEARTVVTTVSPVLEAEGTINSSPTTTVKVNKTDFEMVNIDSRDQRDNVSRKYPVVSGQYRLEAEQKLRGILQDMRDEAVRQHEAEMFAERKSFTLEGDSNASSRESSKRSRSSDFECRDEGRFPDANNCRKYYICSKRRTETMTLHHLECRRSDRFDARKRICVDAEDTRCS